MMLFAACISLWLMTCVAQVPIPNRPIGFVYRNQTKMESKVNIEVFLDLACPDSKAAFPIMKKVVDMYNTNDVRMKIQLFPLPYHHNAYTAAIGAQVAYNYPSPKTTPDDRAIAWISKLFDTQISWSNSLTYYKSQEQVVSLISGYSSALGYNQTKFLDYINSSTYDWDTRVMWKYGCSKGVSGTPWYFVNGVFVDAASWNVGQWQNFIKTLLDDQHILATA